jgi:two-component system, LytTR family, response regulator LytT
MPMKTIIIEDEVLAADRVKFLLQHIDSSIEVVTVLDSVEASVNWFQQNELPDFIILDINLSDGFAFKIFEKVDLNVPVIFTTAFDEYAIDAFKVLSIDYLLKPVTQNALSFALNKLNQLQAMQKPALDYNKLVQIISGKKTEFKTRFLCHIGRKKFFIYTKDISFFCAENKIVFIICEDGSRYIVDHSIEELTTLLDPETFFRANRSVILNSLFIQLIKPYINHRLQLYMKNGDQSEKIIISRERVADFRKWSKK